MTPSTFTKMQGLGNDFIVLDCLHTPFEWRTAEIAHAADRHLGIGFDQLLVIEPPSSTAVDFSYRIFNADGNEVEHCGNGARCFAKYLRDHGLFSFTRPVRVGVKRGIIEISDKGDDNFQVDMGVPDFTPFTKAQTSRLNQSIYFNGQTIHVGIVSMGNPHAVCVVDNVDSAPVQAFGDFLQHHPLFPEQVNVGFMQILNRQHIKLRVRERGVGETLACGTGACAAVAVGIARGLLDSHVQVDLRGGTLIIDWQGEGTTLKMTGTATTVFTGEL